MTQRLPRALLPCLLLFGIVCLLYRPSLDFQFIWDDTLFVVKNPAVQSWDHLGDAFTHPRATWSCDPIHTIAEWRPLRNVSYLTDHSLYGLNPTGWHLTNILLHAAAVCLLFALLTRLVTRLGYAPAPWACFAAALVWAVHPVQTEVVAWVKSRDDLLATPLLFLSLILALHPRPALKFAAVPIYLAALLSKENTIVLAALYPAILLTLAPRQRPSRADYILAASMIVLSIGYLAMRHILLGRMAQGGYIAGSAAAMGFTMLSAFTRYVQLILWPWPPTVQLADYDGFPIVHTLAHPGVLTGLAILAAMLIIMAACWRRHPLVCLALAFFFIAMAPYANIIPMMQVMAERFLYLPLAGLTLLITAGALRHRSALIFALIIALPFAWSTARRLPVWRAPVPFFEALTTANPHSWRPAANLVNHLVLDGENARALQVAQTAQAKWPNDPDILRPLAIAYMATNNEDAAVSITRQIILLQPDDSRASDTLRAWRNMVKSR